MKVFLTIDTETWWFYDDFLDNHRSAVYGEVGGKQYGLPYQLQLFRDHGLKANFFVEPLFTLSSGMDPLSEMVASIQNAAQDVQLHIHTEWLERTGKNFLLSGQTGDNISEFSLGDQVELIANAKHLLQQAGAENITAFRAGNYGANADTLLALAQNGIYQDTSYNYCYLDAECKLRMERPLYQPCRVGEIIEYPITFFEDFPGHFRHLQVTACSSSEMEHVLNTALAQNWGHVVVVLHTFECVQRLNSSGRHRVDHIVLRRLKNLCRFLDRNRDRFSTELFSEQPSADLATSEVTRAPRSKVRYFVQRQLQQVYRRTFDLPMLHRS
ncbi:MAG: hypothetical protein QNJ40_21680 [Xanthomonadales bacterium]|nr:hypothetical protein [Xanthomonadales bacterium]